MYPHAAPLQPHYRQGSYSSDPPHKKPRGNPIITRYPPPPGYRPPPQVGWQQPQQPHGAFAPPTYPAFQQFQTPQPSYTPLQAQQFPQAYSSHQGAYFSGVQPGWQPVPVPQSAPVTAPAAAWQPPPNSFNQNPPRRHSSAPNASSQTSLLDGNGDPMPNLEFTPGSAEDLEEAFDGECYFARHPEEINPDLSLGLIEWKAPLATKRALASTFQEANDDAANPRETGNHNEAVSDYFNGAKREESLLSIRQTEEWDHVGNDLIYREFAAVCKQIIKMTDLLAHYRVQFDVGWARAEEQSPTPELSPSSTPALSSNEPSFQRDTSSRASSTTRDMTEQAASEFNLLDDLQYAVTSKSRRSSVNSRSGSVAAQPTAKITRPKALPPVRDSRQEDILAALGVTGSPKMVYQTPGPAFGPPPPVLHEQGQHSRNSSVQSDGGSFYQPKLDLQSSTFHQSYGTQAVDYRRNPRVSAHSHLSADAMEFDPKPDNDATPKPNKRKHSSEESRKRSYADSLGHTTVEPIYEDDDDDTPKQKRKQQRVDSAKEGFW